MKECDRCSTQGEECSYDVWDCCVACSQHGYTCWPPINLDVLKDKARELRNLRSDAEHLRMTLHNTMEQLKSTHELFMRRRNQLSPTSSEADRLSLSRLQNQGTSLTKDYEDGRIEHQTMREAMQAKLEEKEDTAHGLADLVLDRFTQDCARCVELQQACSFLEDSHICTACTTDVVRCTGDADWNDLDLMWNVADPLDEQVDAFLLNNLPDPGIFQKLKSDEASAWTLQQRYSDREGLSAQERQESSHLSKKRQQIRLSLEQIRLDSFCDDVAYQELLSLREVLTICGKAAMRWWDEYHVELEELTGYPAQRKLPSVDDMTDTQYREAVAWVRTHPFYKYDGFTSSNQSLDDGDAMKIDQLSSLVEVAKI